MSIQLYVVQNDEHSRRAKQLLDELEVEYTEIDVTSDETSVNKLVEHTGQWSVPAVVLDGDKPKRVVVGYDADAIRDLIKSAKET